MQEIQREECRIILTLGRLNIFLLNIFSQENIEKDIKTKYTFKKNIFTDNYVLNLFTNKRKFSFFSYVYAAIYL